MMFFQMFDPLYWLLVGPTFLIAVWAQIRVKSAYAKYNRVGNSRHMSGAEAAAEMLRREGVGDVRVEQSQGWLSDHYDPRGKVLRLSPEVYRSRSVTAVGIAAHEAGHAIQHANSYGPLALRSAIVPLANFGSWLAFPIIFAGVLFNTLGLIKIGIIVFGAVVVFQLVTLPVEFNASSRAKEALQRYQILTRPEEVDGVNSVLGAAAMTYVAATLSALAQLLYFLLRFGLLGGSDE